jgi:hypothetical protein
MRSIKLPCGVIFSVDLVRKYQDKTFIDVSAEDRVEWNVACVKNHLLPVSAYRDGYRWKSKLFLTLAAESLWPIIRELEACARENGIYEATQGES